MLTSGSLRVVTALSPVNRKRYDPEMGPQRADDGRISGVAAHGTPLAHPAREVWTAETNARNRAYILKLYTTTTAIPLCFIYSKQNNFCHSTDKLDVSITDRSCAAPRQGRRSPRCPRRVARARRHAALTHSHADEQLDVIAGIPNTDSRVPRINDEQVTDANDYNVETAFGRRADAPRPAAHRYTHPRGQRRESTRYTARAGDAHKIFGACLGLASERSKLLRRRLPKPT